MLTTQRKPSSYPTKETSLKEKGQKTTSLEELSFIPKRSLQRPSEESPPSTRDTRRCLAKRNRKGYPGILSGIMPSNYSRELPPLYPDDSFPSPKARSPKRKSL